MIENYLKSKGWIKVLPDMWKFANTQEWFKAGEALDIELQRAIKHKDSTLTPEFYFNWRE